MSFQDQAYAEISVLTHFDAVDGISDALMEAGARGVAEERRPLNIRLLAYLPQDEELEANIRLIRKRITDLEREGVRIGPGTVGVRSLEARTWTEAWKDHFQIFKVAPGLTIIPSWENYQPETGELVVVLDPGAAFGTGGHATTRLCLRGIVNHLHPGDRVADVGCGSGILAITAAVLGARSVFATDNDRSCLPVAQSNASRNGVAELVRFSDTDLLTEAAGPFDLVVCNIVAEEIIRLAEALPGMLARGGRCITSGFVTASLPRVEESLSQVGLRMLETPSEEGWAACIASRPVRG